MKSVRPKRMRHARSNASSQKGASWACISGSVGFGYEGCEAEGACLTYEDALHKIFKNQKK